MTLFKQLSISITVLFLLMFIGTITINISNTRTFLLNQLESHAQDTATSLGLSLSMHLQDDDTTMLALMIDAIFDRGYYQLIKFEAPSLKLSVERKLGIEIEGMPQQLSSLISLDTPLVSSDVMSGWSKVGTIYVKSHPGYAYQQLWEGIKWLVLWFFIGVFVTLLCVYFGLRVLLRPLKATELQANAIQNLSYETQSHIPATRELKNVVLAMNQMSLRIKVFFEEQTQTAQRLRQIAYYDSVTKLGNRHHFLDRLYAELQTADEYYQGAIFIVQLQTLSGISIKELYRQRGQLVVNEVLVKFATFLTEMTQDVPQYRVLARISGVDFSLFIRGINDDELETVANRTCDFFVALCKTGDSDIGFICNIGVAGYQSGDKIHTLLTRTDNALAESKRNGSNTWYYCKESSKSAMDMHDQEKWQEIITHTLEQQTILLYSQQVIAVNGSQQLPHFEIFARIPSDDSNVSLTPGQFLPFAERMGLALGLDKLIMKRFLAYISQTKNTSLAVNLTLSALTDGNFMDWLYGELEKLDLGDCRVIFELSEKIVLQCIENAAIFANRVRELGHYIALDHFGHNLSSFSYLQSLKPLYVKLDSFYSHQIEQNQDKQFLVTTICGAAHSMGIFVIMTAVENHEAIDIITKLNVDGAQGYVIETPKQIQQ